MIRGWRKLNISTFIYHQFNFRHFQTVMLRNVSWNFPQQKEDIKKNVPDYVITHGILSKPDLEKLLQDTKVRGLSVICFYADAPICPTSLVIAFWSSICHYLIAILRENVVLVKVSIFVHLSVSPPSSERKLGSCHPLPSYILSYQPGHCL